MLINKAIKKVLESFNLTVSKNIHGTSYKIPLLNSVGALNMRSHEKWMVQLFGMLLKLEPKSIFVDIGVNVGQTLLKIKSVKRDIEYYGFEPNAVCNYYVQQLIKANKLESCHLFPVGLGERAEIMELYIFDEGISSASGTTISDLVNKKPVYTEYISVVPLDSFKDRFFRDKAIGLMKIDVENAELEVLKGAIETIKSFSPFIIIEILPIINETTVEKTNARKIEMQKVMNDIGYDYYKIVVDARDEFTSLELVSDIVASSTEVPGIRYDWNYLIVPRSKMILIKDLIRPTT